MLAVRNLVRAAPRVAAGARQMSVISGPPQVRITFQEKLVHGVVMVVAMSAVPAYILVNLKKYRGLD